MTPLLMLRQIGLSVLGLAGGWVLGGVAWQLHLLLVWLLAACAGGGAVVAWSRERSAAFALVAGLACALVLAASLFTLAGSAISGFDD